MLIKFNKEGKSRNDGTCYRLVWYGQIFGRWCDCRVEQNVIGRTFGVCKNSGKNVLFMQIIEFDKVIETSFNGKGVRNVGNFAITNCVFIGGGVGEGYCGSYIWVVDGAVEGVGDYVSIWCVEIYVCGVSRAHGVVF